MQTATLAQVNAERRARRAVILLTDLGEGTSRVVREGERTDGALAPLVEAAFRSGKSGAHSVEGRDVLLSAYLPQPRLVVIGAVHISQALAPMAALAGLHVEIIDPRTAFATPERFPAVAIRAEWPEDALKEAPLDPYTALAALTHDPKIDDFALKAALDAGCFYVGALGSRKTHAKRLERLSEAGVSAEALPKIHSPIGLDIGAASPPEIAVAVLAEVIAALRSRGKAEGR